MNDLNRLAWIDQEAMMHNLACVRRLTGQAKVIAYIKAGGYGHGIAASVKAFWEADAFSISSMAEARELRRYTQKHPVLLNGAIINESMFDFAHRYNIDLIIHSLNTEAVRYCQSRPRIWLKVNTGMNRMGIPAADVAKFLQKMPADKEIILMTHLADSVRYSNENEHQIASIKALAADKNLSVSFANSARILSGKDAGDWVRPGLMLYGVSPYANEVGKSLGLLPAMTVQARVIAHQSLAQGDTVGYDRSYQAKQEEKIAIISFGYADGFPRASLNNAAVYFQGHHYPVVGRVSMDTMQIKESCGGLPAIGEWVTLWGDEMPIETIAQTSGCIPYEILVHLNDRVERKIKVAVYD